MKKGTCMIKHAKPVFWFRIAVMLSEEDIKKIEDYVKTSNITTKEGVLNAKLTVAKRKALEHISKVFESTPFFKTLPLITHCEEDPIVKNYFTVDLIYT